MSVCSCTCVWKWRVLTGRPVRHWANISYGISYVKDIRMYVTSAMAAWFREIFIECSLGFFEPAQQDCARLSQLEPAWAGKLNAVSWAWNSAQAGSIINFQIKLSSSWLNALSWRFSSAQAGSTIELGWVSLSQVELAQSGSSWMPKKGKKWHFW